MDLQINPTALNRPPATGRFKELHRAINMATIWHTGQDRKYTEIPYVTHPLRVMEIVRSVTDNEDMLVAAVLHDVVEDTRVEIETIGTLFSVRATELVGWLTDISKPEDGNRATRKAMDCQHTADAPPDAKTIKLADLIDNTGSIVEHDPDFARVYMREKAKLMEVLTEGDSKLYQRAMELLQDYESGLVQDALRYG